MSSNKFLIVGSNKNNTDIENLFRKNKIPYIKESISYPLFSTFAQKDLEKTWKEKKYDALIITSTYSLQFLQHLPLIAENQFLEIPLFLSGPETQKNAIKLGFKNTFSFPEWGLQRIEQELNQHPILHHILYLHGEPYTQLSKAFLHVKSVKEICLYSIYFKNKISKITLQNIESQKITSILFLSNKTQEVFHQKMKNHSCSFKNIKALCLSQKIKDSISKHQLYDEIVVCSTMGQIEHFVNINLS